MKRFIFAYDPEADESVVGAFAEACHAHRLRSLLSGIEGAGLSMPRPGTLQIASRDTLERISTVMGTATELLSASAFEALDARGELALGDLILPRQLFELRRRWVAPLTFQNQGRHRADWLNRLLPYCPITLEKLVGECAICGPLGWRTTRGNGACEKCGCQLSPSSEPGISLELADAYRLAAGLMSRNATTSAAAMASLPSSLSSRPRTAVVQVMIRSGFFAAGHAASDLRKAITALGAPEITALVTIGSRIVADWPKTIREVAKRRADEIGDDLAAYARLRRDLKWLGNGSSGGAEIVTLAFPKIDGRSAEMFADDTGYYTTTEANTKLWCKSADLEKLRGAHALDWESLPSKKRLRIRYSASQIDTLADALDDCRAPASAAASLDIPTYAVEQLVITTRLRIPEERGVFVLRGTQISQRSIYELKGELIAAADHQLPIERLQPLRRVLAGHPGEKPWSAVVDLLLSGKSLFRMAEDPFSLRRLLVDPSSLETISTRQEPRQKSLLSDRIALRDAYEILGVGDDEAIYAIRSKGLEIMPDGKCKSVNRDALRELCAEIAFTSEIAVFSGVKSERVRHILEQIGIPKLYGAWSRAALLEHGLVRSVPEPLIAAQRPGVSPPPLFATTSERPLSRHEAQDL